MAGRSFENDEAAPGDVETIVTWLEALTGPPRAYHALYDACLVPPLALARLRRVAAGARGDFRPAELRARHAYTGLLGGRLLLLQVWRSADCPMPTIGALMLVTNGVWWFILPPMKAFVWASILHGIQYLAIVIIFHARDQTSRPEKA